MSRGDFPPITPGDFDRLLDRAADERWTALAVFGRPVDARSVHRLAAEAGLEAGRNVVCVDFDKREWLPRLAALPALETLVLGPVDISGGR